MRSILNALQDGRLFELPAVDKEKALEFLARILDANPDIEVGTDAIEEIQIREREYNTGIGLGVGCPHVRARREEGELFCAIGWAPAGIDYGASDGEPVHLVFMYYIPGAQKNVYLKEVSGLVKAIRKSGGIKAIAHATDLIVVRNLLLDWVSGVLGDAGPEAVARMIKLDIKEAQQTAVVSVEASRGITQLMPFSVLVSSPNNILVLSQDADWVDALEKETGLGQRLMGPAPFVVSGRQIFVTGSTTYPRGRTLYQCVAAI
jgi:mannitol/fructose-specific phosphotransferase system IIA component (Ntr-type)